MLQMSGLTSPVCDAKQETTLTHSTKCAQNAQCQDRLEIITTEIAITAGSDVILAAASGNDASEPHRYCNDSMMMMLMQKGGVVPEKRITTDGCTNTLSYRKLTVRQVTEADMTIIENNRDIVFEKASLCLLSSNHEFDIEHAVIEQVTYLKTLQMYDDNSDEFAKIFGFGRFCHGYVQGKIIAVRPSSF